MLPLKDILASSSSSSPAGSPEGRPRLAVTTVQGPSIIAAHSTHAQYTSPAVRRLAAPSTSVFLPPKHRPSEHRPPSPPTLAPGPPEPGSQQYAGLQSLLHAAASTSLSGRESSMTSHPAPASAPATTATTNPTPKRRTASPSSQTPPTKKRKGRPPYNPEQDDFIRYCRDDLRQSWEGCAKLYNQYWHADGEDERKVPGLQSRYYRLLDVSVRDRKKDTSCGRPELGILATTNRRYWWMIGMYTEEEREEMEREKRERLRELTLQHQSETSGSGSGSGSGEDEEESDNHSDLGEDDAEEESEEEELQQPSPGSSAKEGKGESKARETPYSPVTATSEVDNNYDDGDWKGVRYERTSSTEIEQVFDLTRAGQSGNTYSLKIIHEVRSPRKVGSTRVNRRITTRRRSSLEKKSPEDGACLLPESENQVGLDEGVDIDSHCFGAELPME